MKKVTASQVIREVRRMAREYPDAVYKAPSGEGWCSNTRGRVSKGPKTCGCLTGQALRNCGVSVSILREAHNPMGASESLDRAEIPYSLAQRNWLNGVQGFQDHHHPWGEAVRLTGKEYPRVR